MKKKMSVMLILAMIATCVSMVFPAFATDTPSVSIPVEIALSGTLPDPAEDYVVELAADDVSYPMPEGSENGVYTMTITGEGMAQIPAITYNRVGVYTYTIRQAAGTNEKCTYDDTVYEMTVYITNSETGDGLEMSVVLYPDEASAKEPEAKFENEYEIETEPETPAETETETEPETEEAEGKLTLEKVDADDDSPLEGAVFGVYSDKALEDEVDRITTDEDGVATSKSLPAGTYYVQEIEAPDGYKLNSDNPVYTVTVEDDETVSVTSEPIENSKKTKNRSVSTGVQTRGMIYGGCAVLAAAALIVVVIKRRKEEQ